jgi:hypothetical protein
VSKTVKACGLEWSDTTAYSQGEERIPSCWTAKVGVFRVSVVSSHIYYPGVWVGHCEPFFDTKPLNAKTRDQAMENAIRLIRGPISEAWLALKNIKVKP